MSDWEDILSVPLPLPFPLKIMNAYLIRGDDGYTLIDAGLNTEKSIEKWNESQAKEGWTWSDVNKIVITHYHPDHYGLAGTLQKLTDAPVYISKKDWDQAQLFLSRESDMPEEMASFFRLHGLDASLVNEIPDHLRSFHRWVEPHPEPTFIQSGDSIKLGNREYNILHTPGHADGHLSFLDPTRGWLLGGDALLPRISPNISLWPRCNPNPLGTYFRTLDEMEQLSVKKVFPSHGPVFTHYNERIQQLREHHLQRLQRITDCLKEQDLCTSFEVCTFLFGKHLSIHNLRFALSETLAHLEYLVYNQQVKKIHEKNHIRYGLS